MNLNSGNLESIQLSQRIGATTATTTTMAAVPVARRNDGMLVVVLADYSLWAFLIGSVVTPSGTVIAPAVGTGRWHRMVVAAAS